MTTLPPSPLALDEIALGDIEFWGRPDAERDAVFRLLRDERPISFHDEPIIEGYEQGPGFWAELLPVLLARQPFSLRVEREAVAAQPKLGARLGKQPAEFHPGLGLQFGTLGTAAVGEQIQLGWTRPATKHQGAQPRAAIGGNGGQLQPAPLAAGGPPAAGPPAARGARGAGLLGSCSSER